MEEKIKKCVNKAHHLVFGYDAGTRTVAFTKNVSLSFSGGIIAFAILFVASVVAARILGPEEYGKYAVVFSIAQMLSLFFVLELDVSALYFLSKKDTKNKNIISSINVMFLINIAVFTFLGISLFQLFAPSDMSGIAFVGAVVMALFFALKRMVDAYLRVENRFKMQAIFKIAEAITVVSVIVMLFYVAGRTEYFSYIISIILGGTVFVVLGGVLVRNKLIVRDATMQSMNNVFGYNIFGIIGAIVNSIVKNIDKLIMVAFLGASMGGIYTVYFTASVIVGARLTQLFINVFFPTVRAHHKNKRQIFTKINTLFLKTFIPLIIIASCGVFLIILLYGSQYPIVWWWIVLGGIYIAVHFFASLYGWLLSSVSRKGYKKYNLSFVYSFLAYASILAVAFAYDLFGVTVLLVALSVYRIIGGLVSFFELKKKVLR
ncbi:MAG: oligosaccharide flippase family protein [Patescibacteria group bacterium]|nr:oligosaccharide flippase family protein [Patescibacteria group bacterium]